MRKALISFVLTLSLFTKIAAQDAERDLVTQSFENVSSVPEGVVFIRTTLENQGFKIVATINHHAGARSVGLELRPTQVILFSSSRFDRALIRRKQIATLDLPHKFLVFEDENGDIQLRFNPPGFLIDRHDIPVVDGLITKLDRVLTQFGRFNNGVTLVESSQSVGQLSRSCLRFSRIEGFVSRPS
jgi:uncharacterized protein (DUF302 family)